MKFKPNFLRDYNWYFKYKNTFIFDGSFNKEVIEDLEKGKTAQECFYLFDSQGKLYPTKEKKILEDIIKCKGSINFQIKEWAQDRAKGYLPKILLHKQIEEDYRNKFGGEKQLTIEEEFELLPWMLEAIENQKKKYYGI